MSTMNIEQLKIIIESILLTAGEPVSLERLRNLFTDLSDEERPSTSDLRAALMALSDDCANRGVEIKEVASGFCFQAKSEVVPWIKKLWQERPPRYTNATLETLAIIAYRQPVTRAEIEDIRGVSVSSNIIKTLLDHEWVQVVGQREVPGRPSLYATTRYFLDHFNLKSLEELPPLGELVDLDAAGDQIAAQLPSPVVEAGNESDVVIEMNINTDAVEEVAVQAAEVYE